jgi:beta-N-acetylhexosaminidase
MQISRRQALITGLAGATGVVAASAGLTGQADAATRARTRSTATSQQLAGQRTIYSYSGLSVPPSLLDQIQAGLAGGVIFFGGNISSLSQISEAIQQLNEANTSGIPLLLMTDQEGGEVWRRPGQPDQSEKQIGESSDPGSAAATAGTGAGQLLASVGMNVNLAPVLDVYRTPGDFDDQYQRSYSMNPDVCSTAGGAFISAQQAVPVAATAKHFPGLGAATASQDTDTGPVTLNVSAANLRSIDEYPYYQAVAANVQLVMVSWAVYPSLDPTYPAGLSSAIVQGELRSRVGFTGVTITDALEAGALTNFGDTSQRAVMAAQAGMDLILCSSQNPTQGEQAVTALAAALDSGQLDQADFDAAISRIDALCTQFL